MSDSSEIGRYGTLRLLKHHEPETTLAFFPIDDEAVTFGRSRQCSVRLYYDCVSELHCTIQISEEHKAFLLVQGTNGLLVDGCQVFPSGSAGSGPTTVPLTNGSEIEIYRKRFRFEYPPKEIRAALLATPRNSKSRRSLRMSMIRSAQVFTPRANGENRTSRRGSIRDNIEWEALKSPVKMPPRDDGTQEEMMLLEGKGDNAVVVEEEKDIIVLEQVEDTAREVEPEISPSKSRHKHSRSVAFVIPTGTPPPKPIRAPQSARGAQHVLHPQPGNRRRSAPSLHRAVIMRSAQRALERERVKFEEELEEQEVEASVSPERDLGPFEFDDDEIEKDDGEVEQDHEAEQASTPTVPTRTSTLPPGRRMSVFRASLDAMRRVIPSPFTWKAPEEIPLPKEEIDEEELGQDDDDGDDDDDAHDQDTHEGEFYDSAERVPSTPIRRNLGPFTTPQVQASRLAQRVPNEVRTRASMGGEGVATKAFGGAQRVRVAQPWKIQDITLPDPEKPNDYGKQEAKKVIISEEERQAIIARRKSALATPSSLPVPGPRSSAFPPPPRDEVYTPGEDEDEDTETMLEKMKQKMDHMRRKSEARRVRMSTAGGQHVTAEFSLLADGGHRNDRGILERAKTEEMPSQVENVEEENHDSSKALQSGSLLDSSDEEDQQQASISELKNQSLTPRFDGVREMFRQPRQEPKTPAFTGFRRMFQETKRTPSKTPSLRGVKEMFNPPSFKVPATPHMALGDMFDGQEENNEVVNMEINCEDEQVDTVPNDVEEAAMDDAPRSRAKTKRAPAIKSEDEDEGVMATRLPSERPTRGRKAAAPSTKTSKKGAQIEEHVENEISEEQGDIEDVEPLPAETRRSTKRSMKAAATPTSEALPARQTSGRGRSRSTKKATSSQDVSRGMVVHKTVKGRRAAEVDDEAEMPVQSGRSTKGKGRGKVVNIDQVGEVAVEDKTNLHPQTTMKTEDAGAAAPSRRGRIAKAPHGEVNDSEADSAPKLTRGVRRVDTEILPDEDNVAPTTKPGRGKKAKVAEANDVDELPVSLEHSEEDVTPASTKGRIAKQSTTKTTAALNGETGVDKENSVNAVMKSSGKTPAIRGRRTPAVTPTDVVDVPARRTRSRK